MKKIISLFSLLLGIVFLQSQEPQNNNTTICWDVSASMANRDLEKDFSVLEKAFERNKDQEVQLLLFGIDVVEKLYSISNGNWQQLRTDLENIQYDGGTVYSSLEGKTKNQNVYVFTDGNKILSKDVLTLKEKSYLINSNANGNSTFLERTALINKSRLMDFSAVLPENISRINTRNEETEAKRSQHIEGTVYIDNKPTSDVKVAVKGISDSFLTGPGGNFSIPAQVGDTLVVTSRNEKTVKVVPIEAMMHTNIFMTANIVALDEVVVVEEELEKAEMTLTGYGLQRQEAIGYTVSQIDDTEISEVTTTIGDAINTKVPGLLVPGDIEGDGQKFGGLGAAKVRGIGSIEMNTNVMVVVNGVPMKRSEINNIRGVNVGTNANMDFIDPSNIANITVLKGLAATNAWGSEGRGGVILITTKTAVHEKGKNGKPVDRALLQNNVYDDNQAKIDAGVSPVIQALNKSTSIEDAYSTYTTLKMLHPTDATFYAEAFDYFKDKDARIAKNVISNMLEFKGDDLESLKIVALALSTIGDYQNVLRLNEEIIQLAPTDVNAYFNKALAKRALGMHQEALDELLALANGTYFSVNASGIGKTLDREIKNLIFKHKSNLDLTNLDPKYLNNLKYKVRLVFEWNVPGAEFELQFVNPQKRFFNWEHTNTANRSRLEDEIKNNYRIEEYEFYGDVAGEWVINAKYLGGADGENTPLKLKCTVYKDFGYPSQSKEEVLVHFTKTDEKKNLRTLAVN